MSIIKCLISGGQTGADQGGLFAAKHLDIPTTGIAPAGWKTEAGPAPWLEEYGLIESTSADYIDRTRDNVRMSDGTVIFGRRSPGSNRTEEICRQLGKPCAWIVWTKQVEEEDSDLPSMVIPAGLICPNGTVSIHQLRPARFRLWVRQSNIPILNVAGNRESKNPGIGEFTKQFLIRALK